MSAPPEDLQLEQDLHRLRVTLGTGVDPLIRTLGLGIGVALGAIVAGQTASLWPLLVAVGVAAMFARAPSTTVQIDSDTLVVERQELGRQVQRRILLHTITEVQAVGPELRIQGSDPLTVSNVGDARARWLADEVRAAAAGAVALQPDPPVPEALKAMTHHAHRSARTRETDGPS